MWGNYLLVGLRSMAKNRIYSAINLSGLALGLAACLLIFIYVRHESSYDSWVPSASHVYQLQTEMGEKTSKRERLNLVPSVAAEALAQHFPQVEQVGTARPTKAVLARGPDLLFADALVVDSGFLDIFQLPFDRGNARSLSHPASIALTRALSVRLFGDVDPVGRTVTWRRGKEAMDLKVTAVLGDVPANSHLVFEALIGKSPLDEPPAADAPDPLQGWGNIDTFLYARLRPAADAVAFEAGMASFERRHIPSIGPGGSLADLTDFYPVPVTDVYLRHSHGKSASRPGGDPAALMAFSVIGLLVLVAACVNFVNLSTARAGQRAREVGLRKVLGARRAQLMIQFLGEAILLVAAAMLIALAIVEISLPHFGALMNVDLRIRYGGPDGLLMPLVGLTLLIGAAAGLYPAFVLSRFDPAKVLRVSREGGSGFSGRIRGMLVVGQFAISIGLLICTGIVYAQTIHARTLDPGFDRAGLLVVKNFHRLANPAERDSLRLAIQGIQGVTAAAGASVAPAMDMQQETHVTPPGATEPIKLPVATVGSDYFRVMGSRLLAGRLLDQRDWKPVDEPPGAKPAARTYNLVASESAARRLGFRQPQEAIGRPVSAILAAFEGGESGFGPAIIVGVVGDTRFRSLRDDPWPGLFVPIDVEPYYLLVRFASADPAALRARIADVWRQRTPDVPFEASFAEDALQTLYEPDERRGHLLAAFALLAMIIGCLGLFGLAAYTAERRTREIGVRKVFGATPSDIVRLLTWQFSRPVMIANLVAWPIAWWAMRDWLNGFAERIELHPVWFLAAGLAAFLLASITIAGHALRVSRIHPAYALRYE